MANKVCALGFMTADTFSKTIHQESIITLHKGEYSHILQIMGLASAMNCSIKMIYPDKQNRSSSIFYSHIIINSNPNEPSYPSPSDSTSSASPLTATVAKKPTVHVYPVVGTIDNESLAGNPKKIQGALNYCNRKIQRGYSLKDIQGGFETNPSI